MDSTYTKAKPQQLVLIDAAHVNLPLPLSYTYLYTICLNSYHWLISLTVWMYQPMLLGGLVDKTLAMNGRGMSLNPSLDLGFFLQDLSITLSHVGGIGERTLTYH